MKLLAFLLTFSALNFGFVAESDAGINANLNAVITYVAENKISDDYDYGDLGKQICMLDGRSSYECSNASSVAKGICMASGQSSYECSNASSVAKGICMARGQSSYQCGSISLNAALALPIIDTEWKWDEFDNPNSYGNRWACRGTATGQFADENNCSGPKIDNTWPN